MTAKTFLAKLNAIAATTKKTGKLAIIKTFDELDLTLVKAAMDPTVSYYIAKLEQPPTSRDQDLNEEDLALLRDLAERNITGSAALTKVNTHLAYLHPDDSEVLRRIILKDLRAGFGANTVNTAFQGHIPDFPYMRSALPKAAKLDEWDWSAGVYCQLKCDGSFARVAVLDDGSVQITTRQGNTYPQVPALQKLMDDAAWVFPSGSETHGELTIMVNGVLQPRTLGNGMLNSLQNGGELPDGAEIRFDCWDQIPLANAVPKGSYSVPYETRWYQLQMQVAGNKGCISPVETYVVYSKDGALEIYRDILAKGLEGVIVKHPKMIWRDATSLQQVKFKVEVDLDLKIVGFNAGTAGKRTADTFGSLRVQSEDGLLEADVAGFKRDMETYLHENRDFVIGKILCVKANALAHPSESNEKYSLFHPRFVELRSDKVTPDTLEQVKAQFEAATN